MPRVNVLPTGYEVKERHTLYGETKYYWSFAGGEQWGREFKTRARAEEDAIDHARGCHVLWPRLRGHLRVA